MATTLQQLRTNLTAAQGAMDTAMNDIGTSRQAVNDAASNLRGALGPIVNGMPKGTDCDGAVFATQALEAALGALKATLANYGL